MINLSALENAIAQLEKSYAYSVSDLAKSDDEIANQFRMACIQAFEFTYEISHKILRRFLEETEASKEIIEQMSFKDLIRTAAEKGLLKNSWDAWTKYRTARGTTSHSYDEKLSLEVYKIIPSFIDEVKYMHTQLAKRL
jgi:nucleotidyltransferase substrate binding protein (TIGR01987 family)